MLAPHLPQLQIEALQQQISVLQAKGGGKSTVATPAKEEGAPAAAAAAAAASGMAGCSMAARMAAQSRGGGGPGSGCGSARPWGESLASGLALGASMLVYMGIEDWLSGRLAAAML